MVVVVVVVVVCCGCHGVLSAFPGDRQAGRQAGAREMIREGAGAAHRALQVFSLAYGSVHEEVNSLKRGGGTSRHKGEANLVARVSEEGVTFRSYRWGRGGTKRGE